MREGMKSLPTDMGQRRITDQSPEDFEEDVKRSITILESITGKKIKGYRAPQFTVVKQTLWALEKTQ